MTDVHGFELRRRIDDLVYRFDRTALDNGDFGYKRHDADMWIMRLPDLGWVAVDSLTSDVTGRPWSVPPQDQTDVPPEGEWVSKKGVRSYVYELVHVGGVRL